jgi:hypothetical protein
MQDKAESAVSSVPVEDLIIFSAVGEAKRHVTIFTDMDCGYCRKLHREVPTLNAAGIEVRFGRHKKSQTRMSCRRTPHRCVFELPSSSFFSFFLCIFTTVQ